MEESVPYADSDADTQSVDGTVASGADSTAATSVLDPASDRQESTSDGPDWTSESRRPLTHAQFNAPTQVNGRRAFQKQSAGLIEDFAKQAWRLLRSEQINILLVFVPVGIVSGYLDIDPIVDFVLNALAIIPLAVVISTATETLASRLGDTLGALLNVTVGNAAELMILFFALAKDQIRIVQASLLGSVLANALLVLGDTFLVGNAKFGSAIKDRPAGRVSIWLLDVGLMISIFPTAFYASSYRGQAAEGKAGVLSIGRGTSVGLIMAYCMYLFYQMHSDRHETSPRDEGFQLSSLTSSDRSHAAAFEPQRPYFNDADPDRSPARWLQMKALRNEQDTAQTNQLHSSTNAYNHSSLRRVSSADHADPGKHSSHGAHAGRIARRDFLYPEAKAAARSSSLVSRRRPDTAVSLARSTSAHSSARSSEWKSDRDGPNHMYNAYDRRSLGLPPSPPSTPPSPSSFEDITSQRQHLLSSDCYDDSSVEDGTAVGGFRCPSLAGRRIRRQRCNTMKELHDHRRSREKDEQPSLWVAVLVLLISTGIVAVNTELAVDAIPPIVEFWHVSPIFLGFIVLPLVGNAAEHVIALKLALNNKMVLAKSVAIESSTQVVLFITPAIVLLGWLRGRDMSLQFDLFEIACVVMTAVVVSGVVSYGKSSFRQGGMLVTIYLIMALGALIYPTKAPLHGHSRLSI